jgi:hypothetical protein
MLAKYLVVWVTLVQTSPRQEEKVTKEKQDNT